MPGARGHKRNDRGGVHGHSVLLQEVLRHIYPEYIKAHRLLGYLHQAVWALMACRTAELGGHVEACPEGHVERIHYNSCKHRACPRCAFLQVQQWLTAKLHLLLPCDYYHVIFTLPHALNPLWRWKVRRMTALLFTAMHDTTLEFLHDPKYLGATPGIRAALHTWGTDAGAPPPSALLDYRRRRHPGGAVAGSATELSLPHPRRERGVSR